MGEEDAIGNERLEHIIKKSMQVFWEFVNADKDDENLFHKTSHYRENKIKDKEISDLVGNIRTQLHKVFPLYFNYTYFICALSYSYKFGF